MEGFVAEFILVLKFSIVVTVLLNCIIGQVNERVFTVLECKLVTTRPDVALFIPEAFYLLFYSHQQHVTSDVKFPLIIQEGLFDIFLQDISPYRFLILSCLAYYAFDRLDGIMDSNTIASVRIFPWFENPYILGGRILLFNLVEMAYEGGPGFIGEAGDVKGQGEVLEDVLCLG